ncbi:DMT family transporter [Terasakiella sp. A23]|uniref:DMT family transporter n=1 Tax=Terasakiella sp. FCG-A23 TaxID=3080561 RepID=UPI002952F829|nr:DMT family transporter [Terasakiella sp. A23]MDV7339677.1 DMT family transporter [Terasakiella sp. A23]
MTKFIPVIFVFLWSTGFIGAKFGLPYAEPYTFLFIRMVLTSLILLAVLLLLRKSWPSTWRLSSHVAFSGLLIHVGYLGGVFTAIAMGMPAGLVALIAGLQPLLTAFAAQPILGEKVKSLQWAGLVLGLIGVVLVLSEKLDLQSGDLFEGFGLAAVVCSIFAVLSITASSLYQKKYCTDMPLMSGTFIQYAAAAIAYGVLAFSFDTMVVNWTGEFIFALFWLIFVPSFGAISLLMWMIKQGAASKVASMFYLVPPVTALEAFFLFGEALGLIAVAGMVIASIGVWLAVKS